MENDIKVGEYVRTKAGRIANLYEKIEKGSQWCKLKDKSIYEVPTIAIKKHSKSIIDLIEVGDILELKEGNDIAYLGLKQDTITVNYKELLESIKDEKSELISILTHEQYDQNCYKLEEK